MGGILIPKNTSKGGLLTMLKNKITQCKYTLTNRGHINSGCKLSKQILILKIFLYILKILCILIN